MVGSMSKIKTGDKVLITGNRWFNQWNGVIVQKDDFDEKRVMIKIDGINKMQSILKRHLIKQK